MPVGFLPAARQDALRQHRYLAREAGSEVAERFLTALEDAITRLARHPSAGSPVATRQRDLVGVRAVRIAGFELVRIYYLQHRSDIRVIRILHARRDVSRLLGRTRPR